MLKSTILITCVGTVLLACGGETAGDADAGGQDDMTGDDSSTEASSGGEESSDSSGGTGGGEQLPPTDSEALLSWLEDGSYSGWAAESAVHESDGPHFGGVRAFVNTALDDSLASGADAHPAGSAAVKELYGDGGQILGWSVSVKLEADSADGDNWYWYEKFNDSIFADGPGEGLCTGCHSGGEDFFLSPYPLQ